MVRFLSLALTPWAIFVSSSLSLYLLNQENLDYNPAVLLPFLGAAAAGLLIGYGIQYDSEKHRHYPSAPWAFYLAGPAFMLWNTLDGRLSTATVQWMWLIAVLAAWVLASLALKRRRPRDAAPYFALFAALIMAADAVAFVLGAESPGRQAWKTLEPPESTAPAGAMVSGSSDLPNIYHLILDGYQSDIFALTLDQPLRESLQGFRYYPQNISLYANTALSVPSVFSSTSWLGEVSAEAFAEQAFTAPDSLPVLLRAHGYDTTAYLNQEFAFEPNRFVTIDKHHEFATARPWTDRAFMWLWVYAYLPAPVARYSLGAGVIERIENGQLSPEGSALVSLDVFEGFLAREPTLPGSGRYTFLHLLLPHPPYRMSAECEAREWTSELEQYRCANRIIMRLVAELRRLDRFDGSLVVIHADHGDDLDIRGPGIRQLRHDLENLDYLKIRARALLLYKPAGEAGTGDLQVRQTPTTLLDVAPTILSAIGASVPAAWEGYSLDLAVPRPETRYFHTHNGVDMRRYAIRNEAWSPRPEPLGKSRTAE